jgi:DNA ligase-1
MKEFAALFRRIDETNKTNAKVAALKDYFLEADDKSKLWAIALMSHRRPKRPVNTTLLRTWAAEMVELPTWLFEETYHVVGDLAETITLILPDSQEKHQHSLIWVIDKIIELKDKEEEEKKDFITTMWKTLDRRERFVFNKIITGGFRMGVSQKLMTRALSQATGVDENIMAHRIMGNWNPDKDTFQEIILEGTVEDDLSKPYPFFLAYALEGEPNILGDPAEWSAERKWDGIRGQIIIRQNHVYIWSRGEELVTDKYPEFANLAERLPDGTVMDGELLPFKEGSPLPFQKLQTRIGRKNLSKKLLETTPVRFMVYDLLEENGNDIRELSFKTRRKKLEQLLSPEDSPKSLMLSPVVKFDSWEILKEERERSRELHCEGIMLKHVDSPYEVGRKKGGWWKWKIDPYTIDAVLTYAMRGHGRRANLYTDYTFGLWDGNQLVTFAKAYSGLTDNELREIDRFVKANTLERFGPVRQVVPQLVFEIAFEGIAESSRHKSGIAVRFPRIHRWRRDKKIEEANTLGDLKGMLL